MAKGKVVVDVNRCKGCGLCTNICPSKILIINQDRFNTKGYHPVMVSNPESCVGCGSCAIICPDIVFTVYRYIEQRLGVPVGTAGRIR
jgi:2-oxoglutarate ferredoxin oxidoreductase subunit delta